MVAAAITAFRNLKFADVVKVPPHGAILNCLHVRTPQLNYHGRKAFFSEIKKVWPCAL